MQDLTTGLVFAAGLLSFFSPCVLPLVPGYLAYLAGSGLGKETYPRGLLVLRALGFVAGFSLIFLAMGATASTLGQLFVAYRLPLLRIGGFVVIIFGLHLMGVLRWRPLLRERRFALNKVKPINAWSSVPLGMAFATGWTPCIGPVLGSVLLYAGSTGTVSTGVTLLAIYSLGLGLPFLLVAVFFEQARGLLRRMGPYLPWISRVGGFLLVLFGLLILFDKVQLLNALLPSFALL